MNKNPYHLMYKLTYTLVSFVLQETNKITCLIHCAQPGLLSTVACWIFEMNRGTVSPFSSTLLDKNYVTYQKQTEDSLDTNYWKSRQKHHYIETRQHILIFSRQTTILEHLNKVPVKKASAKQRASKWSFSFS